MNNPTPSRFDPNFPAGSDQTSTGVEDEDMAELDDPVGTNGTGLSEETSHGGLMDSDETDMTDSSDDEEEPYDSAIRRTGDDDVPV